MANKSNQKTYAEQLSQFMRDFMEIQLHVTLLPSDLAYGRESIDKMRLSGAPEHHNVYAVLFHMMSFLSQANRPTMTEIRQALSLSRSTTGRMVDSLVAGGFCKRYSDSSDKRIVRIALTRKGLRALQASERYIAQRTDLILHGLTTDDQAALFTIFNKIASNVRKSRGF
jgi:DNA-binding MarR family transcriptional regulator